MFRSTAAVIVAVATIAQLATAAPTMSSDAALARLRESPLCKVPEMAGSHPAIDLNPARFDKPAVIRSRSDPTKEFRVQVCDLLNYTDKVCTKGSSVCEYSTQVEATVEVYGYVDSIKTAWVAEQLLMTMSGGKCTANEEVYTTTKIYFSCATASSAGAETLKLRDESAYGCYVEFDYPTVHACGATPPPPPAPPAGDKYKCHEGKCAVAAEGGVPKDTCESLCGGPPPPSPPPPAPPADDKYKCHEGKCTVAAEGGVAKDTCESLCGGPPPPSPPPPPPPAGDKYKCHEGKCAVAAEGGVPKDTCESLCGGPPPPPPPRPTSFNCLVGPSGPTCEGAENGNYTSEPKCLSECHRTWLCKSGECEAVIDGSGASLDYCKMECSAGEELYKCSSDKCVKTTDGTGSALKTCEAVCSPAVLPSFLRMV